MKYELIKEEFIRVKKEELEYIDNVAKTSSIKMLNEEEKLFIYRNLINYQNKLNELLKELWNETPKDIKITRDKLNEIVIEFEVEKDYLSLGNFRNNSHREYVLDDLGLDINTHKFKLYFANLFRFQEYKGINIDVLLNNQRFIDKQIYVFCGYYDSSEDCYGPCFGNPDDYIDGIYEEIWSKYDNKKEISKKQMAQFELDKIIIHTRNDVYTNEIKMIFLEELLNINNKTINNCVIQTRNRVDNLSYIRSFGYKEKVLLDKINKLYKDVKGEFINSELLYDGEFIKVLKEIYKLPNNDMVRKEKVVKNNGKNSVIIIPITNDKEYIVTVQNRIKDTLLAEFPSGYIEIDEDPVEAAKRELLEETGYITEDLFIIDCAYTSLGIDNSITYIVVANSCSKVKDNVINSNEFISYGLFSEKELEYLINNNIINGAMNKLAYYNLVNNTDSCNVTQNKKHIYKTLKKKKNSLNN